MFMLRAAFWLTVVVAFIPVSRDDLKENQEPVSAGQTISLARTVISDLASFCERNTSACATGSQLASQMGAKAREGARIVYTALDDQFGTGEQPAGGGDAIDHTATTASLKK